MAKANPSQDSHSNSNTAHNPSSSVDSNNSTSVGNQKEHGIRRARSPYREPPVAPPVPSYVHDRVSKNAFTSGMMPLGTMPPESLKRKVFGTKNKKVLGPARKRLNGDGSADTPEAGQTGRNTRAPSTRNEQSEAASSPAENNTDSVQNTPDPLEGNSSRVPQYQTVGGSALRPISPSDVSPLPAPSMTGPLPQVHIPRLDPLPCYHNAKEVINKAIVPDRRQYLFDALKYIHQYDTGDVSFHDLLEAASAENASSQAVDALNRQVKILKDHYHLGFRNKSSTTNEHSTDPITSTGNHRPTTAGNSFDNQSALIGHNKLRTTSGSLSNHQASIVGLSSFNPTTEIIKNQRSAVDPSLTNAVAPGKNRLSTAIGSSSTNPISIDEHSTSNIDTTMPRKRKVDAVEAADQSPRPPKAPTPATNNSLKLKLYMTSPSPNGKKSKTGKTSKSTRNKNVASSKSPRRGSSSGLSAVNEDIVQEPPSTNLKPNEAEPGIGDKRKRSEEPMPVPAPDPEDEEVQAKRQRMSESLVKVNPPQSSVRSTLNRRGKAWNVPTVDVPASRLRSKTSRANSELSTPVELDAGSENQAPKFVGRQTKEPKKQSARIQEQSNNTKTNGSASGAAKSVSKKKQAVVQDNVSEDTNDEHCASCDLHMNDPQIVDPLLCCEGCPKSMHPSCLDPPHPVSMVDEVDKWYCDECKHREDPAAAPQAGIFGSLLDNLPKQNPKEFSMPSEYRDGYFIGCSTGPRGEYVPVPRPTIKGKTGRSGYDEAPDFKKERDSKGQLIVCYKCKRSSEGKKDIIPCDYCSAHWHTDCLDPPMANGPYRTQKEHKGWMCPLHSEHETGHIEPTSVMGVQNAGFAGRHRMRKFTNPVIQEASHRRGYNNNGYIEIEDDLSDYEHGNQFMEDDEQRVVPRVPASGIILNFIEKAKQKQLDETRYNNLRASQIKGEAVEMDLQRFKTEMEAARMKRENERAIAEDISRRSYGERQAVGSMNKLAGSNKSADFDALPIEKLIHALNTEAPPEVIELLNKEKAAKRAREDPNGASKSRGKTGKGEDLSLSPHERNHLLMLKRLIESRLAATS
ncbi:MAG: hypothetical protein M1831_006029 [Alyxoria varia]|nr:MAG: hypothetical protein M1831_006029 [Alyxoria varia]